MKIKILDAAEKDLEDGYLFYESRNPGLGSYFLDSIYADIDSLAYFGGIHMVVFGYRRMLARRFRLLFITVSSEIQSSSLQFLIVAATQVGSGKG